MDLHVGKKFGEYEITAILDARRMGPTCKVEHCLTKRTEAMKVLSAELASETEIKRFEREMRVLARLSHPNIAVLHNAIHSENELILLMEFIDGQTLQSILSAGGLPLEKGMEYIKQVLLALRYAHQQGVVHRDITPANIMITAAGEVKLSDFGLSKAFGDSLLTTYGEILGSLPYLAPEQLKTTTQPDCRSDLYAVGAILYELLTGQKPFGANRKLAPVLTDSEAEPPPPSQLKPSLAPQWDDIIGRALARNPRSRYQSAEEFLAAIAELVNHSEEFVLPHMGPLAVGVAIVAGLGFALVALPAINPFHLAASAILPFHPLHISPPAFATNVTSIQNQIALGSAPRVFKPAEGRRSKLPATTKANVIALAPPAHASNPALSAPTPSPEVAIPTVSAGRDVNETIASERAEVGAVQVSAPKKKAFWSKLNVFRKKSSDPKEKP